MTLFWTFGAAMLLLGMLWIIPPLVRPHTRSVSEREQQNIEIARERLRALEEELALGVIDAEQFAHARLEVEQILATDLSPGGAARQSRQNDYSGIKSAMAVGLGLPLVSILLYGLLGNPAGLSVEGNLASRRADHPGSSDQAASVDEMVRRLAERLNEDPNNPDGWRLLARSYTVLQRYPEAVEALRRARGLVGDDPDLLIELADAIATAQGGSFEGQPDDLIAKVLEKSPQNPGGLWLAGRSALVARDFSKALKHWRQLEAILPQGEGVESVRLAISRVEEAIGKTVADAKPVAETTVNESPAVGGKSEGAEIKVRVALDQSLSSAVEPDDAVFVYAQALSGPPMPLAVTRKKVRDLPIEVILNDSMAMMPQMALSKFSEVRIIARVSKTGNAIPQSGDFKGQAEPISVMAKNPVEIKIAEKIP
ncbi:MAG: c-type cytochrome biogenesis protein CcmI [Gammaproteobacteria bacterium]